MEKIEAKFTTYFQKWLKHNYFGPPLLWEVKVVKEKSVMNFNKYILGKREHQLYTLLNVSEGGKFIYKFSDFSQLGTPCDGICLKDGKGVYVIKWVGDDCFYIIDSKIIKAMIDNNVKCISKETIDNLNFQKVYL